MKTLPKVTLFTATCKRVRQDWSISRSGLCLRLAARFFKYWLGIQIFCWSFIGILLLQYLIFSPTGFSHDFGNADLVLRTSARVTAFMKECAWNFGVVFGALMVFINMLLDTEDELRTNNREAVRYGNKFPEQRGVRDEK